MSDVAKSSGVSVIHAGHALTAEGWRAGVRLHVKSGRSASVQTGVPPEPADERHEVLLPALANLHSHAFQRAMAGFAETPGAAARDPGAAARGSGSAVGDAAIAPDNFWTWRETMYRLAHRMNPDQLEAISAQAYVEMLEAGFGRVGEFHYLHHDPSGAPYEDCGEMAGRIAAAAEATGIGLTLLPVFYAHANFGGAPFASAQRRFVNTLASYESLLNRTRHLTAGLSTAVVGVAPHSLRAVTPEELKAVTKLADSAPIHIHIAEQVREVDECVAWCGQRPVEWLLAHVPLAEQNWCLVHATQVTTAELTGIAAASAVIGLCPVTEANLGDGVFPVAELVKARGRFGIGTDSNVHISVAAELSLLEYSQRLTHRARNIVGREGQSTGRALLEFALAGGHKALGAGDGSASASGRGDRDGAGGSGGGGSGSGDGGAGSIAPGAPADFLSLNTHHPALCYHLSDALVDAWIFGSSGNVVDCVWVAGRKVVKEGRHVARDRIERAFSKAMKELHA